MSNLINIARKEYTDLLSNRMVLIVIAAFFINILATIYSFYAVLNGMRPGQLMFHENIGIAADNNIFFNMSMYGTIMGIIIGCSTISGERSGRALNTLITKPIYRDTIINGKIVGSLAFLASVIIFYIVIFTSGFLLLCGDAIAPYLFDYLSRLPFVIIFIMVYTTVFLSISLLISLLIRDQAFAMILSTLTVYISGVLYLPNVANNLDSVFPGLGLDKLCIGLSPESILWWQVQPKFMNTSVEAVDAFLSILPEFGKLLVYIVIALSLSYVIFIRGDIQ